MNEARKRELTNTDASVQDVAGLAEAGGVRLATVSVHHYAQLVAASVAYAARMINCCQQQNII
jgi:hypothetical protein